MNDVRSPSPRAPARQAFSRLLIAPAIAALFATAVAPYLRAVQPEYASLLAMGRAAYDRKAYPAAVRSLRLACFGMLDEPKSLADCLTRLALAQDRANDPEGFQETFQRLTDIEAKFAAYSQGEIAADLRAALEPRIQARIPAATLEGSPGFRFLAPRKTDQVAAKSPAKKGKPGAQPAPPDQPAKTSASPPSAKAEPAKPRTQVATNAAPGGAKPPQGPPPQAPAAPLATDPTTPSTTTSPTASPASPPPAPPSGAAANPGRPWSDGEREKLQQAREKLSREQTARELKTIFDGTKEIADAHPDSRDAQHLVGQAAYRLSRWSEAVSYFKRGGDPGDEQSELLFYVAVSLFESGDTSGAAAALKRALPNLRRTPYVDKYAKKILGQ
jgi:tetratricopeptide (TPR) repeat protein